MTPELLFISKLISPLQPQKELSIDQLNNFAPLTLLSDLKRHKLEVIFLDVWTQLIQTQPQLPPEWKSFTSELQIISKKNQLNQLKKAAEVVRLARLLDTQLIRYLMLKGPVLSQQLYGNRMLKTSVDLDMLVDARDLPVLLRLLPQAGYVLTEVNYKLTDNQLRYQVQHFHHLGFYHPQLGISLELHWQLVSNKYLLPLKFETLYAEREKVWLANYPIDTLGDAHNALFLAVHGAGHKWFRINWLYDFASVLAVRNPDFDAIERQAKQLKLQRIWAQSVTLSNRLFATQYPLSSDFYDDKTDWLVNQALKAMQVSAQETNTRKLGRLHYKWYAMQLKPDTRYRWQIWSVLGTNSNDWRMVKLPNRLFWLYFVLRPFIYVKQVYKS